MLKQNLLPKSHLPCYEKLRCVSKIVFAFVKISLRFLLWHAGFIWWYAWDITETLPCYNLTGCTKKLHLSGDYTVHLSDFTIK